MKGFRCIVKGYEPIAPAGPKPSSPMSERALPPAAPVESPAPQQRGVTVVTKSNTKGDAGRRFYREEDQRLSSISGEDEDENNDWLPLDEEGFGVYIRNRKKSVSQISDEEDEEKSFSGHSRHSLQHMGSRAALKREKNDKRRRKLGTSHAFKEPITSGVTRRDDPRSYYR